MENQPHHAFGAQYITEDIKLATHTGKLFKTEVAFEHHMLVWLLAGESKIVQAHRSYHFGAGDLFLIPRNQLATVLIQAGPESPHRSVAMHLTPERLRAFYGENPPKTEASAEHKIHRYSDHPLLKSCMASLLPYFEIPDDFPEQIASLKITEALTILRTIDPNIDGILAHFGDPHKVDLGRFMEAHFIFNMPLEKFGYLTGRSLTNFKRDFRKLYQTTPQQWLTQKRLERAHYLLAERQQKPTEVYLEIGFENLSHFSYAFKKKYGYPPTRLGAGLS